MLADIEGAIVTLLETADLGVKKVEARSTGRTPGLPAIYVTVNAGALTRIGQPKSVYKCQVSILVHIMFENFANQDQRRKGMNTILEGALLLLMDNDVGLDITPLKALRFGDITDADMAAQGLLLYALEFSTNCEIRPPADIFAGDLLRIGLAYYLQEPADDHITDADDLVNLAEY